MSSPSRTSTRLVAGAAVLVAGALVAGCAGPAAATGTTTGTTAGPPVRGQVVSVTPVAHLDRNAVAKEVARSPFARTVRPGQLRHGVDAYRVRYRTPGVDGDLTTATGLVTLPRGGRDRLRVVVHEHGTLVAKRDTATYDPTSNDRAATAVYASGGLAAVAPDYLGLGGGPGPHPYLDLRTETSATLDLLTAARSLAHRHGRSLERGVDVTGFSQGGSAAMAVGRALQNGASRGFGLRAVAGVSGPYDVRRAELPAALWDHTLAPSSAAFYLAYLTVSANRRFHLYDDPSEVFRGRYARTVPPLFDNEHPEDQVFRALPRTPEALLTASYRQRLLHPTGPPARALASFDGSCDWSPRVPVRLYTASKDGDVTPLNSAHCRTDLRRHGSDARLVPVGPVDHNGSAARAVPAVARWFAASG